MGVLQAIGNFMFGRQPDIFDEQGEVLHKHPKRKWDNWQNRYKNDPHYNWRHHSGLGKVGNDHKDKADSKL